MSGSLPNTISQHITGLRDSFDRGVTAPLEWRLEQLRQLERMLDEREADFEEALADDLGKHPVEAQVTEISFLRSEIAHAIKHLPKWIKRRPAGIPAIIAPARAWVTPQPLGLVLVISPWNYPLLLALSPLVGAIAAGNAVIIKPSEVAAATSRTLATIVPEYLDPRAVRVVEGAVEETTELLTHRFDHIFFTGNSAVGRIIARAAAEHLTPVTLELGGKSPAFVDEGVDVQRVAQRIAWGKYVNAGQTCVAPDYVMATPATLQRLETALADAIYALYGNAIDRNPDYGRIVSDQQFDRLVGYLGEGNIAHGGRYDRETRYIEPTILTDIKPDAAIMREEIFGPILPLIPVDGSKAAIDVVRAGHHPLSAYVFSDDPAVRRDWEHDTVSGALAFGSPIVHLTVPDLPFGGVGESGMGSYHGQRSFDTFSHLKAVLNKPLTPDTLRPTIMPPFTGARERLVRSLFRMFR